MGLLGTHRRDIRWRELQHDWKTFEKERLVSKESRNGREACNECEKKCYDIAGLLPLGNTAGTQMALTLLFPMPAHFIPR